MPSSSSQASQLSSVWQSLPTAPGIYIYKDANKKIIYVGKAKSLRNRVRSYFQPADKLGPKTAALVSQITSIEHVEVNSEIEALLLESRLIKKHKPQYNLISKDDKSPYYIHISKEVFPRPIINHNSASAVAGPFLTGFQARTILKQFRRVAPFCVAKRPVKKPCFYSHLGLCNACPGIMYSHPEPAEGSLGLQYKKNILRLRHLLAGNFSQVSRLLKKEMQDLSAQNKYEQAAELRDNLLSLETLLSQPVMPDEFLVNPNLVADKRQQTLDSLSQVLGIQNLNRIEMYDIANLQGTSATAAMTVALNGEPNSKFYRHFTIKSLSTPNDVGMMAEVLTRRLAHTDWPVPNLIVLDGGKSQLSAAQNISVPVISLAKKEETIFLATSDGFQELKLPLDHPGLRLLQRLRDESHRFSRRLHHKHRKKTLIPSA